MDAQAIISNLAAKGVTLVPDGDSLIARPRERLTDADRGAIRQYKADLIAHLRAGIGSAGALDSATETGSLNRPVCPACHGSDLRVSHAGGLVCQGCGRFLFLHAELGANSDASAYPGLPLRRCGSLVCRGCHAHSPGPHREGCWAPRFEPCHSRWFWLSPYRAIKCVACASPADLALVEAWVLARETGEGDDGWRMPGEILSLLHISTPMQ
jgi:TubC N-terminal docking domain